MHNYIETDLKPLPHTHKLPSVSSDVRADMETENTEIRKMNFQ